MALPLDQVVSGKILWSKTGLPTLSWKDKLIHSRYDPRGEAQKKVRSLHLFLYNRIHFLPADFLYAAEEILKRFTPGTKRYYFYYPDLLFFSYLLTCRNLDFLDPHLAGCHFLLGEDVGSLNREKLDILKLKGSLFVDNRSLKIDHGTYCDSVHRHYHQLLSEWYTQKITRMYFEKTWIKNGLINLATIKEAVPLQQLKNRGRGEAALLVGAGPSLYEDLPALEMLQERCWIIACDTALKPLLRRGLCPDIVVCLDSGYYNYLDFEEPLPGDCLLVADLFSYPRVFDRVKGPVSLFYSSLLEGEGEEDTGLSLLRTYQMEGALPPLKTAGSISHTVVSLGFHMGFERMALLGMDMQSTFYDSHIVSGTHFQYFLDRTDRLHPPTHQDFEIIRHRLKATGEGELREVPLEDYRQGFEGLGPAGGGRFNASRLGRDIPGFPKIGREDLIKKMGIGKPKKPLNWESRKWSPPDIPASLSTHLEGCARFLARLEKKEIENYFEELEKFLEGLRGLAFIERSVTFLSHSILRREDLSPYLATHHILSELYKFLWILKTKVERRSA